MDSSTTATIITTILTSCTTISAIWLEQKWSKKSKKNKLYENIENEFHDSLQLDISINEELALIRDKYGLNRVSLVDYHNGTSAFKGFSFKNMSMRYERSDNVTKPIITEYQSIPCSMSAKMLLELESNDSGYIYTNDKGGDDLSIMQKSYGVKFSYIFKIGNSLTNGSVGLISTHDPIELTDDDIMEIKAICRRIYNLRLKMKKND